MPKIRRQDTRHAIYWGGDVNLETRIGKHITVQPDGCWTYGERSGYVNHPHIGPAHRFVYETLVGPIPKGHHLHHECETKNCVNPAHLVPLTPAEHRRRHARSVVR